MKRLSIFLSIFLLLFLSNSNAGQFNSGSTGADGAFNPTTNTELQLPPDGIFNFTTVNIPSGVTVTFKKNAANTPVYILATGDVTIAGAIRVNATAANSIQPGVGGSGGFDGGFGGVQSSIGGKGVGPGGGNPSGANPSGCGGARGGYGGKFSGAYGNNELLPLIGGSGGGGGGGGEYTGGGGGGGGGALLIASSTKINITGTITTNGGSGASGITGGGGGSGGAIKLVADVIYGNGAISAAGGSGGAGGPYSCFGPLYYANGENGGDGRIRLEANTINRTAGTTPGYTFGYPGAVFVANMPTLQIASIGGVNVSSNPTGSYASPDIKLPAGTTNPVAVTLSASNIPVGTTVTVSVIPQFGSATNVNTTLSGTSSSSTATASVNLSTQYPYILTATATFTMQTAMYYDGEKIEKVRVATSMGKGSEVTYITETGKEVPYEKLMASIK